MHDFFEYIVVAFQGLYSILAHITGYGIALILFSMLMTLLISPLMKYASKISRNEAEVQSVLAPQIASIKSKYTGKDRQDALNRLYRRYRYSPVTSIKLAMQPLLQLPILFVAYWAFATYEPLRGISFLGINDLGKADDLLFGLPLLPFVMTAINILTACISPFTQKEKKQSFIIAAFFLIILFNSPAALLIYWTCNNLWGLLGGILSHVKTANRDGYNITSSVLSSFGTTIALSLIIPPLYVWGNNIAYFRPENILLCLIIVSAGSICLGSLAHLIFIRLKRVTLCSRRKFRLEYLFILMAGAVFVWMARPILLAALEYKNILRVVIVLTFILVYYVFNIKFLNKTLLVTLLLSIIAGANAYEQEMIYSNKSIAEENKYTIPSILLSTKPNIYYFLCESYQNPSVIKEIHDLDLSGFIEELKSKGFVTYDNVYSNGCHTLATLTSLFSMHLNGLQISHGNGDANLSMRDLISGGPANNLFRILKENGYQTHFYLKNNQYFFSQKGKYLDETDIIPNLHSQLSPIWEINSFFSRLSKKSFIKNMLRADNTIYIENDSEKILKNYLSHLSTCPSPHAYFTRLGITDHTPSDGTYTYKQKEEWVASKIYANRVLAQNEEIKKITDAIIEHDPNSVIIFLGDHGVHRLRGYPSIDEKEKLRNFIEKDGENVRRYIDDMFYVFAAVRMPSKELSIDSKFTSVNVFQHVFMKLCPEISDDIKKYIAPNLSLIEEKCFVRDGVIKLNDIWTPITSNIQKNLHD